MEHWSGLHCGAPDAPREHRSRNTRPRNTLFSNVPLLLTPGGPNEIDATATLSSELVELTRFVCLSGQRTQTTASQTGVLLLTRTTKVRHIIQTYQPFLPTTSRALVTSSNRRVKPTGSPALAKTPIKRLLVSQKVSPRSSFPEGTREFACYPQVKHLLLMAENISPELQSKSM